MTEGRAAGEGPLAQLTCVGLADDDSSRGPQPPHYLGVRHRRRNVTIGTEPCRHPRYVDVVLDRKRNPQEWKIREVFARTAFAVGRGGIGERLLGEHHSEGVQRGLAGIDRTQGLRDEVDGRDSSAGQPVEQLGQGGKVPGVSGDRRGLDHVANDNIRPDRAAGPTSVVGWRWETVTMRLYRDRAVVLRQHKLGEADRIITLLTREHGLVRAVAKGVRRTRSKFGARLEPFAHIDVQLHPGRNLDIVTQVQAIDAFASDIVSDYGRYTSGCAILETAERLAGEERAPAPALHRLTVGALRAIADGGRPRELVLDAYLLRAMGITGWAPALVECARCAAPGPHRAFHVAAGGSVCVHCRPSGSVTPPQAVLELMVALHDGDWAVAEASSSAHRSQASGLVAAHLQWHLERQLRTLPLVERVYRIDRTVADQRAALVGQDIAYGNQAAGEDHLPTAAAGA